MAGYGFKPAAALPDNYITDYVLPLRGMSFLTTGETMALARNHCAAVCAVNLLDVLLFQAENRKLTLGEQENLFKAVHRHMGNGPVFRFDTRLNRFLRKEPAGRRMPPLSGGRIRGFDEIIRELHEGRPCMLLLAADPLHWHYVLAVGYREYEDGKRYLRIANSWQKSMDCFYPEKGGAVLLNAAAYRIASGPGS